MQMLNMEPVAAAMSDVVHHGQLGGVVAGNMCNDGGAVRIVLLNGLGWHHSRLRCSRLCVSGVE